MHLVRVSEYLITDLESGREYDYLLASEDGECACDRVRGGDMFSETMDWDSHYQGTSASDEDVNRANRQAKALWDYLVSQCKFDAFTHE